MTPPPGTPYLQRRATTHEIVLICTQVVVTDVGLDDVEICIDRLVANKTVSRTKLAGECQIWQGLDETKGVTMNRRSK
jgi:hypothetical protein